jgi:hypothetical protein
MTISAGFLIAMAFSLLASFTRDLPSLICRHGHSGGDGGQGTATGHAGENSA